MVVVKARCYNACCEGKSAWLESLGPQKVRLLWLDTANITATRPPIWGYMTPVCSPHHTCGAPPPINYEIKGFPWPNTVITKRRSEMPHPNELIINNWPNKLGTVEADTFTPGPSQHDHVEGCNPISDKFNAPYAWPTNEHRSDAEVPVNQGSAASKVVSPASSDYGREGPESEV
ncbi:hypothetical protein DL93DRAFT_422722 [Clavulina sp. PMI_390]|nr:hypothetical protein DL93DRAFT_422722 [Clavulina sp. PMI_390]